MALEQQQGGEPKARVGLIIPSVNTFSEPQFNRFAPEGLGIHIARARVAGEWKRPLPELKDEIATASKLLSDVKPNAIVFHCTDTSMTQGPQGEGKILDIVQDATGIPAMATSRLVLEALQKLGMKKVVLLTPYKSNKAVIDYLTASGIEVVRDIAMKLEPLAFGSVTPAQWAQMAKEIDGADADGVADRVGDCRERRDDGIAVGAQASHSGGSPMSQRECAGFNWPPLSISAEEPVSISPETVSRAGPVSPATSFNGLALTPCWFDALDFQPRA